MPLNWLCWSRLQEPRQGEDEETPAAHETSTDGAQTQAQETTRAQRRGGMACSGPPLADLQTAGASGCALPAHKTFSSGHKTGSGRSPDTLL